MFGTSYFGRSYFGTSHFGPDLGKRGGTTGETEYTEEDAKGMKAVYGVPFKEKEITKEEAFEKQVEEIIDSDEFKEIESIPYGYLEKKDFKENLELLESKAKIPNELRVSLEQEQDIGLILAIIEAIE